MKLIFHSYLRSDQPFTQVFVNVCIAIAQRVTTNE